MSTRAPAPRSRTSAYLDKRITEANRYQLPGYWTLLQILAMVGLAIFLISQLLTGNTTPTQTETQGAAFEDASITHPTTPPADVPDTPTTPADPTNVVDINGNPTQVPTEAADTARNGLRALFSPDVASTVPVSGGGTMPVNPDRNFPDATIGTLVLVNTPTDNSYTFTATTDADGPGSTFGAVNTTITVTLTNGTWVVETN